jgi:putative transposase
MAKYHKGSHTVYELHYHFVFITKYCKPALRGEIAKRARDLIRDICASEDVTIIKGNVSEDHVHLMVSMPPEVSPS